MISEANAREFAHDWIDSWNSHDLDRVVSHYDKNVEYYSAFVNRLTNNGTSMLSGKESLREYFRKGLEAYPDLHFHLHGIFIGVASITIQYESVNNLIAAEVFELNEQGRATRVQCHYKLLPINQTYPNEQLY